jgi:hypothetical protein
VLYIAPADGGSQAMGEREMRGSVVDVRAVRMTLEDE